MWYYYMIYDILFILSAYMDKVSRDSSYNVIYAMLRRNVMLFTWRFRRDISRVSFLIFTTERRCMQKKLLFQGITCRTLNIVSPFTSTNKISHDVMLFTWRFRQDILRVHFPMFTIKCRFMGEKNEKRQRKVVSFIV